MEIINKYKKIFGTISVIIILLVIFYNNKIIIEMMYQDLISPGYIGDVFSSLDTLFSALAFIGLIYTVKLQSKELELQRNEISRQAKAQEEQEVSLRKQAESLKATAKLNGLNSLLNYYQSEQSGYGRIRNYLTSDEIGEIIEEIKGILKEK